MPCRVENKTPHLSYGLVLVILLGVPVVLDVANTLSTIDTPVPNSWGKTKRVLKDTIMINSANLLSSDFLSHKVLCTYI